MSTSPYVRKRKRRSVKKLSDDIMGAEEERMLHMAIAKSKVDTQRNACKSVPSAKIFRPTLEEFKDPMVYLQSIRAEAQVSGICKIIPPEGWNPPLALDLNDNTKELETRLQRINCLQEGKYYDDGRKHTFQSYQEAARVFGKEYFEKKGWNPETITSEEIEKEYWRIVETNPEPVQVEYANDLDTTAVGSGFERATTIADMFDDPLGTHVGKPHDLDFSSNEYYKSCGWNLNNIPQWPGSLLRHIRTPINGVNVPWLYCGMLFATFCWHTEDNYLYSVNYMHHGAKKRWYGVPAHHAHNFEKVLKKSIPLRLHEDPELLFHLVTMLSPSTLKANNVEVYSLLQEPGEIVVTFPQSYHSGYSEGFNCNEAVNFALPDWIGYSTDCTERYRRFGRLSVFSSDRLLCKFTDHLEEHSDDSRELLLEELKKIRAEENMLRRELKDLGILNLVEMPSNTSYIDGKTMKYDDTRQCKLCKHSCFFSAVMCKCSQSKIACLRHATDLCKCSSSRKYLLVWETLFELDQLIQRVENFKLRSKSHDVKS